MKTRAWLLKTPFVFISVLAFLITHWGERGELRGRFLREDVFPYLRSISGTLSNIKFRVRGPVQPKNKIIIVEVSGQDLEKFGRWPLPRRIFADVIDRVLSFKAKTVGLDIAFSEPQLALPHDLRGILEQRGLSQLVEPFDDDKKLEGILWTYQQQLVLGWLSENYCQPGYHPDCPLFTAEYLSRYPADFEKFGFTHFEKPNDFDAKKTILISSYDVVSNLHSFNQAALHSGSFDIDPDPDGYIRRTALLTLVKGVPQPRLSLEMARVGMGEELKLAVGSDYKVSSLGFKKSGYDIPVTKLGVMNINFRGPSWTFPYVTISSVLSDSPRADILLNNSVKPPFDCKSCRVEASSDDQKFVSVDKAELFQDAYVLIGISAKGVYDMRAFPFDANTAGVEGHANILDNLLAQDPLIPGSMGNWYWVLLALMTLGALLFLIFIHRVGAIAALFTFILSAGAVVFVDQFYLFNRGIDWNTAFIYLEFISIFAVTIALKYISEEKSKQFIRGAFSKYVAPAVVDSIIQDPSKLTLGGEKREITILFSDVRGFTTFSEKMDPKSLSAFLNDYLGSMTRLIKESEGTLDKYIGDAVMAFWGAPLELKNHASNACRAAIQMMKSLEENAERLKSTYGVEVHIGIGINSGQVSIGNMGSKELFSYTPLGDNVNLASRLEGLTKEYGVSILTSRYTFDAIAASGESFPPHRILGRVKVKGKKTAVELIQVLDHELPPQGHELYEKARALYEKREWEQAMTAFQQANQIMKSTRGSDDGPCQWFIERLEGFRQNPPNSDWDGSWEMTSK